MSAPRLRAGLIQLTSSDAPVANLPGTEALIRQAAAQGAQLALTPENTNMLSANRARQREILTAEAEDLTLRRLRALAAELKIWLLIGSLGLQAGDEDGRFANRSILLAPDGAIKARYDKIHMFDATVSATESWRESAAMRPGERAVIADTPWGGLGMTICYDLRFPVLYRDLAQAGARILTVPSAFTRPTGQAHWEVLLRARAIETGCFVLAPAQTGAHAAQPGDPARETWGHSLVVDPWGAVLADAGEAPGVTLVDLDLSAVDEARARIGSLGHDRAYQRPQSGD